MAKKGKRGKPEKKPQQEMNGEEKTLLPTEVDNQREIQGKILNDQPMESNKFKPEFFISTEAVMGNKRNLGKW